MSLGGLRIKATHLTVIVRNEAPMLHCDDAPSYRRVTVELTDEQRAALAVRCTHTSGGTEFYESYSRTFLEDQR